MNDNRSMNGRKLNGAEWDKMVRHDGAKAMLDEFGAKALRKLLKVALTNLQTDESFAGSTEGNGESRQIVMTSEKDGYRIRLLVHLEAREKVDGK